MIRLCINCRVDDFLTWFSISPSICMKIWCRSIVGRADLRTVKNFPGGRVQDGVGEVVAYMLVEANKVAEAFGGGGGKGWFLLAEIHALIPVKLQKHANVNIGAG